MKHIIKYSQMVPPQGISQIVNLSMHHYVKIFTFINTLSIFFFVWSNSFEDKLCLNHVNYDIVDNLTNDEKSFIIAV